MSQIRATCATCLRSVPMVYRPETGTLEADCQHCKPTFGGIPQQHPPTDAPESSAPRPGSLSRTFKAALVERGFTEGEIDEWAKGGLYLNLDRADVEYLISKLAALESPRPEPALIHTFKADSTGEFCGICGGRSFAPEHPAALPARSRETPELLDAIQALAECYRLTGADPDDNEDWRLAPLAVGEVRRFRDEAEQVEKHSYALMEKVDTLSAALVAGEARCAYLLDRVNQAEREKRLAYQIAEAGEARLRDLEKFTEHEHGCPCSQYVGTVGDDGACVMRVWPDESCTCGLAALLRRPPE